MTRLILLLAAMAMSCILAAFLLLVRDVCRDNGDIAYRLADRQRRAAWEHGIDTDLKQFDTPRPRPKLTVAR